LTRDQLIEKRELPTAEIPIDIPGVVSGTVLVRALTRGEVLKGQTTHKGVAAIERFMLATAMVDPVMTEDDIAAWQRHALAGELDPVANKVQAMSKMIEDADKEQYKSLRDEPGE
jgi:hypothetical protein